MRRTYSQEGSHLTPRAADTGPPHVASLSFVTLGAFIHGIYGNYMRACSLSKQSSEAARTRSGDLFIFFFYAYNPKTISLTAV